MSRIPKLHEIIAVIDDSQKAATKIVEEGITTFTKKQEHFSGHHASKTFFDEKRQTENTETNKPLVSTVQEKLDFIAGQVAPYFDLLATRDVANTQATESVIVDGVVVISPMPPTFLLTIEQKLKDMRRLYDCIPTMEPNRNWVPDPTAAKPGVYKTPLPETRIHSEKVIDHKILVPATDKHPAQVKEYAMDVNVARTDTIHWSAMMTPADKSKVLMRLDKLIAAVKQARQRANGVDAHVMKVGNAIFDYLHA